MKTVYTLFLLAFVSLSSSCLQIPYGIYEDERSFQTIVDDKAIATDIKAKLMGQNFSDGFSLSVYCFKGHVFLIGTAPEQFRQQAIDIAKNYKGVTAVTAHWFLHGSSFTDDTEIKLAVGTNLISTKNISSTQVETNVHGGHVVLLGVVNNAGMAKRIFDITKNTSGVKEVISYLIIKHR